MERNQHCPICRASAWMMWIDERQATMVDCENCTTFTITLDCAAMFASAWLANDPMALMRLEHLSRHLRLGGDDCDRDVTAENWSVLAIDGEQMLKE